MARDVKINGVTYTGVSVVQAPLAEGGTARFMQVNGDPGELEKWKAAVKIDNSTYPDIGQLRLPLADGTGMALYLYGNGDWETTAVVAPNSKVQVGDFVKIMEGLYPSKGLYPAENVYPSGSRLVKSLGASSDSADGVALTDGAAGQQVTIYIPA